MIDGKPANVLNGYLLRLIVELDTRRAGRLLRLYDRLVKGGIIPFAVVVTCRREQIQVQPVVWVGEVRAPLRKAKLYQVLGRIIVVRSQVFRVQINMNTQGILPHLL